MRLITSQGTTLNQSPLPSVEPENIAIISQPVYQKELVKQLKPS
jgi:hypothetical protein